MSTKFACSGRTLPVRPEPASFASSQPSNVQTFKRLVKSIICHTSEKYPRNSNHCHTSKNTRLKVLHLPHIQKTPGGGPLLLQLRGAPLPNSYQHFILGDLM